MKRSILTFDQFKKHKLPSEEVKGTSALVKDHYASEKDGDLSDPKRKEVKGNGSVEHTEEIKADDLSDPKFANESVDTSDYTKLSNEDLENLYNELTTSPEKQKTNLDKIKKIEIELNKRK